MNRTSASAIVGLLAILAIANHSAAAPAQRRNETVVCEGMLWTFTMGPSPQTQVHRCTTENDNIRAQILKTCINGKPCRFEALASVSDDIEDEEKQIVAITSTPVVSDPFKYTIKGNQGGTFKGYDVGFRDIAIWNDLVQDDDFVRKHLLDGTARLIKGGSSVWWHETRDAPGHPGYPVSCVSEQPNSSDSCFWVDGTP